jgi:hypothetical protein
VCYIYCLETEPLCPVMCPEADPPPWQTTLAPAAGIYRLSWGTGKVVGDWALLHRHSTLGVGRPGAGGGKVRGETAGGIDRILTEHGCRASEGRDRVTGTPALGVQPINTDGGGMATSQVERTPKRSQSQPSSKM